MNASPGRRVSRATPSRRRLAAAAPAVAALLVASLLVAPGLAAERGAGGPGRPGSADDRRAGTEGVAGPSGRTGDGEALTREVDDAVTGPGWAAFDYDGDWRAHTGGRSHRGTEHYTASPGSRYTMRFQGAGIALYGTKDRHHGIAAVRVDDGPEVLVDLHSPTRRERQLLFAHRVLPVGEHRVEVRVTGERDPAASGAVVTVDRAEVTEARLVVDDSAESGAASFAYSGDWSVSRGPGKHGGGDHQSGARGSSYRFRFSGSRVQLFGAEGPGRGRAAVSVDGGEPVEVDLYAEDRREGRPVFASEHLEPGPHVVEVTVTGGRDRRASDNVVAVDRAVVTIGNGGRPGSGPAASDTADRPDASDLSGRPDHGESTPYRAPRTHGPAVEPDWVVEPGSADVEEIDGKLVKDDPARFHRLISRQRFGGPGKTVTIQIRARATAIRNRRGSRTVEGAKIGMKWPVRSSRFHIDEDDPRSVFGNPDSPTSPGSYIFVTGLTEGGYMELSRNPYGPGRYRFFGSERVGYEPGTWKDVVVTVEWLDEPRIRVRYWHNADGTGRPVYEATDDDSPFWDEPGFLWLRTDDADWEYDYIRVRES